MHLQSMYFSLEHFIKREVKFCESFLTLVAWTVFFSFAFLLEYQSSLLVHFYHTRPESFENTKILAWLLFWGEIWILLGFKFINWHVGYNIIK